MNKYENVAILGAGLAGLGCALQLPGARVFEAKNHPGGHAYSHFLKGVHFDEGAHICHTQNKQFLQLICKNAGNICKIEQSIVSNRWKEKWLTYPVQNHLRQLPIELRISALTDLIMAQLDVESTSPYTYREWCLQQYGKTLTDTFYRIFTKKYWRTAMEDLSIDWLSGRLLPSIIPSIINGAFTDRLENQTKFTKFYYPQKGGFFSFFNPLYSGLTLEYNQRVSEIDLKKKLLSFESGRSESFEILASSIPITRLIKAIKDVPTRIIDLTDKLNCTKSLLINVILNVPTQLKEHWFYIYDEHIEASRVSIPSNISPNITPKNQAAFQAEIFRRNDESWNIDALQEKTLKEMQPLIGYNIRDIYATNIISTPYSYIISDLNREPAVSEILNWLTEQEVYSMGLYGTWKYMWSDAAFFSGKNTASHIIKKLNN